jgi:plastocyanin
MRIDLIRHRGRARRCAGAFWRSALLAAGVVLALAAPARAANQTVMATAQLTFSPATVTINAGDTITWINNSGMDHNVYALDGSFRCANGCDDQGGNGDPAGTWQFSRTFNQPGTIQYECQIHGPYYGMKGTIVVQGTAPAPACAADANTLCLGTGGRFKVAVTYASSTLNGNATTVPLPANPSSGLFYFFSSDNIEMLVKVLNGCTIDNAYWVFFAATTNVQFTVTVTDTSNGQSKTYNNPLNQAAQPVQDTSAFATCP